MHSEPCAFVHHRPSAMAPKAAAAAKAGAVPELLVKKRNRDAAWAAKREAAALEARKNAKANRR